MGAGKPTLEAALVSASQYKLANSIVAVDASDKLLEEESNDDPCPGRGPILHACSATIHAPSCPTPGKLVGEPLERRLS
jgi:hypothetical protein